MAGTFSLDLARICKKHDDNMRTVIRKIAFEAFKKVIMRSPVDTGRFRANWGVSVGSPWTGSDENLIDKDGGPTSAKAQSEVLKWNAQGSVFLANNLAYSIPLEYGHSTVKAPQGMVRVTCAEMQAWAQSAGNVKGPIGELDGVSP